MRKICMGGEIGALLCEHIGIDPKSVIKVQMNLEPNELATIQITRVVYFDEFQAFARELKEKYGVFSLDPK